MDKHLPDYHFSERHRTRVGASPEEVIRAVAKFTRPPDPLSDLLLALRTFPSRLLGRKAPRSGKHLFAPLEGDECEMVAGLIGRFGQLDGGLVAFFSDADAFARFAEPGTPKLVTGFRATRDRGGGTANDGNSRVLPGSLFAAEICPLLGADPRP